MVKVILLSPPFLRGQIPQVYRWDPPEIAPAYLAAVLEKNHIPFAYYDLSKREAKQYLLEIKQEQPDIVGITSFYTKKYNAVRGLAKIIRKLVPNSLIITGGPHLSGLPGQTMNEIQEIDVGVIGEGEQTLLDIIRNRDHLDRVNGIIYREKNGKIQRTLPRDSIANVDELPFPKWEIYDLGQRIPYGDMYIDHKLELPVLSQRGCPFHCVFCQKVLGDKVRTRPITNVLAEIEHNIQKYQVTHIFFCDESFGINQDWLKAFCIEFMRRGFHKQLKWGCYFRISTATPLILKLMRAAGCQFVFYGIESALDPSLRMIRKGTTVKRQREAIKWTKKAGIKSYLSLILGFPGENLTKTRESIRNGLKMRGHFYQFNKLLPFPGTKIYQWAKSGEKGLKMTEDWNKYDAQLGGVLKSEFLPEGALFFNHILAYMKMIFYLFPGILVNVFRYLSIKKLVTYIIRFLTSRKKRGLSP